MCERVTEREKKGIRKGAEVKQEGKRKESEMGWKGSRRGG